jgi:hypothetical protein
LEDCEELGVFWTKRLLPLELFGTKLGSQYISNGHSVDIVLKDHNMEFEAIASQTWKSIV